VTVFTVPAGPLPAMPRVLVEAFKRSRSTGPVPDSTGAPIGEGGRNAALTSLAGTMRRRGMSEAAIRAALRAENAARCVPPLDDAEVDRIAASVASYPSAEEPTTDPGDTPGSSWAPRPLADAAAAAAAVTPPELLPAADGSFLVYRGRRHLLYGEPETLKSWIALAVAADVMRHGGRVVWIDTDGMGAGVLLERFRAIGGDVPVELIDYIAPDDDPGKDGTAALAGLAMGTALVVLDAWGPAFPMLGLSGNSGDDVNRFVAAVLDPFHRAGATVLVLDHMAKDRDTRGDWPVGSERKRGWTDVAFKVTAEGTRLSRETAGGVRLKVTKDRPGFHDRSAARRVLFTPDGAGGIGVEVTVPAQKADPDAPFRPTTLMERVSRHLEVAGSPLPLRQAIAVAGNAGAVRTALSRLVEEGFVEVQKTGPSHLHRVVRPYREAEDTGTDGAEENPTMEVPDAVDHP